MKGKEPTGESAPLQPSPPKVTRINRRLIAVISATVSAIVAFALVAGLSPKESAKGEAAVRQPQEKNQTSPGLPDPLVSAPGTYAEAKAKSSQRPTPRQNPEPAKEPTAPVASPLQPAYTVTAPGQPPGERGESQAQKDAQTAINSPVTFGQNEAPQQPKQEEPRGGLMVPPLPPGIAGMPQAVERYADDQNLQGEKREFSRERQAELPYIKTTLIAPISQYEIKAGTILPATLITGINSDLPGQIVAQLRENVYDSVTGNHLLVPQGTRLIGEYDSKVAFGQERVLVIWTRLILPNGSSIGLEGMPGIDLSGYAGMTGKVNNHYGKLITGVVLGSVIGAGAQVAVGGQGAPNVPPSFGQLAVSGAAQNINQTAQRHTDKVLNMQPTIEVTPGDKINVFVTKDMILKPFTE
uniref:Conjugation TrbI family protein n=1 Tax=Geobacter sp. (strain M21) TaxID=443144 RepID=C6DZ83_GEOSM